LAQAASAVPPDFTDSLVASLPAPTALAFTPDGRVLVTSQAGALRVVQAGSILPTPALDLTSAVCSDGERGLLGVAVDPGFASNHFIYLYYTAATAGGCVNRVSRFALSDGSIIDPASETVLLTIPSPGCCHNAGNVQFGKTATSISVSATVARAGEIKAFCSARCCASRAMGTSLRTIRS
jgi:glucose/arabinose dehydrogenase